MLSEWPDSDFDGKVEESFSISIWAKASSLSSIEEAFFSFGAQTGLYTGVISRLGPNISFNSSNWGCSYSSSNAYIDENWHHWVFVWDYDNYDRKIFKDGSLIYTCDTGHRRFNIKDSGLAIGKERLNDNPENKFTGDVDDIRIWKTALTNSEVSNLYSYDNSSSNYSTQTLLQDLKIIFMRVLITQLVKV